MLHKPLFSSTKNAIQPSIKQLSDNSHNKGNNGKEEEYDERKKKLSTAYVTRLEIHKTKNTNKKVPKV